MKNYTVLAVLMTGLLLLGACGTQESTSTPEPGVTSEAPAGSSSAAEVTVTIVDLAFQPHTVMVATGMTVTWHNEDGVAHTVTSEEGGFDSGQIAPGGTYSHRFDGPGTFRYKCENHERMDGVVIAGQDAGWRQQVARREGRP